MRLTLRTLLAYRDNVLSPADREDLHRRIQTSQYGGNLLRGIGELTQRNAVAAPPVLGKGLGADANSIAEYLDDALPHSQVPELERVCLDSAVHLAELADCHSLLSSAARTKVSVSDELRRMALGLGEPTQRTAIEEEIKTRRQARRRGKLATAVRGDAAQLQATSQGTHTGARPDLPVEVEAPMLVSGGESIRPQGLNLETSVLTNEVPDYLIGSASGQWKFPLAIAALSVLLGVLVWQSLGPMENVMELFAQVPNPTTNGPADSSRTAPQSADLDTIVETEQVPPGVPPTEAAEVSADVGSAVVTPRGSTTADAAQANAAAAVDSQTGELESLIDVDTDSSAPPGLAPPEAPPRPAGVPTTTSDANQIQSAQAAPPGLQPSRDADVTAELLAFSDQEPPHNADSLNDPSNSQAVWMPLDEPAAEAVILWHQADVWKRVAVATPLPVGSQWVIPPATRTSIELPGGVHWTACGPSQLKLVKVSAPKAEVVTQPVPAEQPPSVSIKPAAPSPDSASDVGIAVQLGRALVRGGPDGRDLRLSTPVGDFNIQWQQPNSLVSIEVAYRPVAPGSIVDLQATQPVLVIVAADESVKVRQLASSEGSYDLSLGDGLACVGGGKPITFRLQNIPSWYRSTAERPIDKMAAADLHRFLQSTKADASAQPAEALPQLGELSHSRRPETAALAVQTALLCGDWSPLLAGFLDDARMRSHWLPTIDLAQQVLAANLSAEPQIRAVFNETYGDAGAELFKLLQGLPADQLDPAGLAAIVQRLESPQLAFRVLAWYQLQALTGKTLGVQPTAVSRNAIQQWRRELATSRDLLLPIGDPIWERVPK